MTNKQKTAAVFGILCRMAAAPALFLLMFGTGSLTAYAAGYNLYIGNTQVTETNASNIFGANGANGEPTAKYDAGTKTLYLNGVHIDKDHCYEVPRTTNESFGSTPMSRYSLFADTDVVRHLVITGDNSFVSAGSEVAYEYTAIEDEYDPNYNEDLWAVDKNGDGQITLDDMELTEKRGESGICFSATGTGAENAFTITGDGTLTSTSTEGTSYKYDCWTTIDEYNHVEGVIEGSESSENIGTALTVKGKGWVYMGDENGTGPTLELNGWDVGADFRSTGKFAMQGGTVIAKATNSTAGTGVYLTGGSNFFEGGTIAGYGIASESDSNSGAFSNKDGKFDTTISKEHGMQRVYPATVENDETDIYDDTRTLKIRQISGWCAVGMTADAFKASTDAVLNTLGLDPTNPTNPTNPGGTGEGGGTNPGTDPTNPDNPGTEGNRYHTDTVPDPGAEIDVLGFTKAATVYSVDVEWGVMTFEYEKSSWNADSHTEEPGRGWVIYDNVNDKVIEGEENDINKITVTNHSNASVYATLSYTGNGSHTDIAGAFTKKADDAVTNLTPATGTIPAYLTLTTADNNNGVGEGVGQETVGTVYFMPTSENAVDDISSWNDIGKITVGILTQQPQEHS